MWVCLQNSFSSYSTVKIVKSNPETPSEDMLALRTALVRGGCVNENKEKRRRTMAKKEAAVIMRARKS